MTDVSRPVSCAVHMEDSKRLPNIYIASLEVPAVGRALFLNARCAWQQIKFSVCNDAECN